MAKTKISKVAKDLNVSLPTVIEFLRKKNITVDENPNTRLEDDVVGLLMNEFKSDKDLKNRSEQIQSVRQRARAAAPAPAPKPAPEEVRLSSETSQKPRILGKLELNADGSPVVKPIGTAEVKTEAPVVEKPVEQPAAPRTEQPRVEEKPRVAVQPKAEKPVEKPQEKTAAPEQRNVTPEKEVHHVAAEVKEPKELKETKEPEVKKADEATPAPQPAQSKDEEVFTIERPKTAPSLNIIGKIDLDAINQTTRPKKKTKEERRNERARGGAAAAGDNADRKKRRRITGKEKVDIEKVGRQSSDDNQRRDGGGQGRGSNAERGGRGANNGGGRDSSARGRGAAASSGRNGSRRQAPAEVNEEDVSKQVKETLARLTAKDKALKKGAKWRKEKREASAERAREAAMNEEAESRVLKLTEFVTANDLASMMDVPINNVIATCMNLGVMVSINQRLDAETINIVAEEFGFTTEYVSAEVADAIHQEEDREEDLVPRPPVVTVMGHVDHGKTSLLDYIRSANVIAGEAGGITQHIGSYSVKLADGRHITFLDTPGHEAFTAMRARGAKVTDLCIIIVAADDAVMPQTVEAINHASAAGVPIVFAINKVDKPHANPDKIKEELAAMNYLVEEWGGKYQSQDISAKKGTGVDELMDKVLLEAEMLELKANPDRNAVGTIIESSLDKGRGYVANVLVQNGTLRVGDVVLAGNHFGKVKAMFNERNQRIKEAGPATPALILGLNGAPTAGDTFNVLDTEQEAREIASKREQLQREQGLRTTKILTLEDIGRRRAIGNFQELNIIVKGDVDGSIEALSDSLIKLSTEEIQVNVLHKAVGEISESDVTLAAASNAIIIGFQVRPSQAARRIAERDGVEIRLYSVIYQAIEEVKDAMAGMLAPELREEITGSAEILETYHISRVGTIAGCMVREGKIKRSCKVRLIRQGIVRYTGELGSLKRFKDDVKEVASGYDCGISIKGYNDIAVGDIIEAFEEVEVARTSL